MAPPSPGSTQFSVPAAPPAPPAPLQRQAKSEKSEAGGIVQLVDHALQGIDLRPEQTEALERLGAEVEEKMGPVSTARKNLALALADEVEAGKVDKETLKPEVEDLVKAAETASPFLRAAFQKLHDVLDSKQREEFVNHFRAEVNEAREKHSLKDDLDKMAQTLKLTDDEKSKIGGILERDEGEGKAAHDSLKRVIDAFASDSFSLDQVFPAGHVQEHTEKMAGLIIEDAREVTDVLTPEQRKAAADSIRSRIASKMGGGESTGATGSSLEATGSESQGLWAARGFYGGRGFGYPGVGWGGGWGGAYGFSRGYAAGYGGAWMF
jgi:hypothetical protein